jgi:hypothetical protein
VALVRTNVSEEFSISLIRVTVIVILSSVSRLLFMANVVPRSCHPDDGGATSLRNVGSYKSFTALHPEDGILHFLWRLLTC